MSPCSYMWAFLPVLGGGAEHNIAIHTHRHTTGNMRLVTTLRLIGDGLLQTLEVFTVLEIYTMLQQLDNREDLARCLTGISYRYRATTRPKGNHYSDHYTNEH